MWCFPTWKYIRQYRQAGWWLFLDLQRRNPTVLESSAPGETSFYLSSKVHSEACEHHISQVLAVSSTYIPALILSVGSWLLLCGTKETASFEKVSMLIPTDSIFKAEVEVHALPFPASVLPLLTKKEKIMQLPHPSILPLCLHFGPQLFLLCNWAEFSQHPLLLLYPKFFL